MGEIVNLRQARKAKKRSDEARQAEENRARFGRSKAEKALDQAKREALEKTLDQARRDPGSKNDE